MYYIVWRDRFQALPVSRQGMGAAAEWGRMGMGRRGAGRLQEGPVERASGAVAGLQIAKASSTAARHARTRLHQVGGDREGCLLDDPGLAGEYIGHE